MLNEHQYEVESKEVLFRPFLYILVGFFAGEMGRLKRKRMHKNIKDFKKKCRTRKRTKDLDQIHDDLKSEKEKKLVFKQVDDLPGGGQFYCIHCAKHHISEKALVDHLKSKVHKRRLRLLKEKPYTQEEAEMAAGMGSYVVSPKILDSNTQRVVQMDSAMSTADESLMSP